MGFLGNLLGGGKVDVEGSIAVLNRPAETTFILTTAFFPCEPGARPLATGVPEAPLLDAGIPAEPTKSAGVGRGDPGDRFTARLPPGHYQVCILALPFVIDTSPETGQPRMVTDPNNRFGFWPLPTAVHLQAGQKRVLSLKLNFPKGLGRFGERTSQVPFIDRIGPANRANYERAVSLARGGNLEGAFKAYQQAFSAPEVGALVPADANELRLVLGLGQYKCLLDIGTPEAAESCRQQLFANLLPKVRLSEADPATAWDVMSTCAIVGAQQGQSDLVSELLPQGIEAMLPQLGARNAHVAQMVQHALISCLSAFTARQNWRGCFEVAEASLRVLDKLGPNPISAVPTAYQLEGALASGSPAQAQQLISNIGPDGRAALLDVAQEHQLARVTRALAPIPPTTARA